MGRPSGWSRGSSGVRLFRGFRTGFGSVDGRSLGRRGGEDGSQDERREESPSVPVPGEKSQWSKERIGKESGSREKRGCTRGPGVAEWEGESESDVRRRGGVPSDREVVQGGREAGREVNIRCVRCVTSGVSVDRVGSPPFGEPSLGRQDRGDIGVVESPSSPGRPTSLLFP